MGIVGRLLIDDSERHYEILAIPTTFTDIEGAPVACVMEILFDRTEETRELEHLQNDTRALLDLLFQLVANISESTTQSCDNIIQECEHFSKYLSGMDMKMQRIMGMPGEGSDTVFLELPNARRESQTILLRNPALSPS